MLVSDHGGGSLKGVVNLNAWLAREGFLQYTQRTERLGRKLLDWLIARRRHLPKALRYRVKQRAGGLRERMYEREQYSVVDWPRTRAFSYGSFGSVVVNLNGRERDGIVEPGDEYERVRVRDRRESALELRGPDGERDRRRRAPARGPLRRAGAGEDPRPADRVPRLRVARQGQLHQPLRVDLGRDRARAG